ncbi:MAG: DNA mismatch repair endonuclease MutL [Clostridia bacterium]|nr:DNA mismatch repair endonuclease MutL [Clostridia bacterium]
MGVINQLSADIANKIAAGEVVERPGSVVKELVENAIDAGADVITVEIEGGGTTFLRVTDNGCGMTAEDAELCFSRHATSKIKSASDLEAIYTLGFRGEALSSIGAVSSVELFTKRKEDSQGTKIVFQGGALLEKGEAGTADGTSIIIRDLFYNTPARMKFLKKDATEAGYVADIMSRFILAHPEISFRLTRDSKEVYFTPGDSSLQNALYSVYGRDYAKGVIDVDYELDGIRVTGAVGKSEVARANRTYQSFFVNRRYIKSPAITRAVEDAYKNQLMVGKFPMAVLNIELDPASIDINVHPTKLEVKFSNDQQVFLAVHHAVKNALYSINQVPEIVRSEPPKEDVFSLPKEAFGWEGGKTPVQKGGFVHYEHKAFTPQKPTQAPKRQETVFSAPPKRSEEIAFDFKPQPENVSAPSNDAPLIFNEAPTPPVMGIEKLPHDIRVIGQLFSTYILAEIDGKLAIIDQHAAHERLKFEELKKELANRSITPQYLIAPIPAEISPLELSLFEEYSDKMSALGFDGEVRNDEFFITAVPSPMDEEKVLSTFCELLTAFSENRQEVIDSTKERLTHTIACKAAIKANHNLSKDEMLSLISQVLALKNINTCPHGRPIMITMSKTEIEKEFGRIQ